MQSNIFIVVQILFLFSAYFSTVFPFEEEVVWLPIQFFFKASMVNYLTAQN